MTTATFATRGFSGSVGNTPLIRLNKLSAETGCEILGKAEFMNPGGSVKDRAARGIIDAAAGPQQAARLGVADHLQRRAVLHRLAGVHELGLAEDFAAGGFAGAA